MRFSLRVDEISKIALHKTQEDNCVWHRFADVSNKISTQSFVYCKGSNFSEIMSINL